MQAGSIIQEWDAHQLSQWVRPGQQEGDRPADQGDQGPTSEAGMGVNGLHEAVELAEPLPTHPRTARSVSQEKRARLEEM